MPTAIDEIRKLGRRGHFVIAADTFGAAPGAHSKYAAHTEIVASPRYKPEAFVDDIARIIADQSVDMVVPCFEEALYLARARDRLPSDVVLSTSSFEVLDTLHDKARSMAVANDLGVRAPRTIAVTSRDELTRAMNELGDYFAKPIYSRGGVDLVTNRGPLAKARPGADCNPSPEAPWVVEEYVDGLDICSFSVAHRGRVAAHATYVHPREIEHAGGTVFESVDEPEVLDAVQRFVEWADYEGQIGFDFRRNERGLYLIECNPRPTAGVHLLTTDAFVDALLSPHDGPPVVAPAGVRAKYSFALLRNMVLHTSEALDDLKHLFSGSREAILDTDDPWPAAYQFVSLEVVRAFRRRRATRARKTTDVMEAYFDDISWNGEGRRQAA